MAVVTYELAAETINAAAAGRFDGVGWEFSIGGRSWIIDSIFTHDNGVQFRFHRRVSDTITVADNAAALAFIAADFTVDVGIAGQNSFDSSVMENVSGISAAQYRAFPGRFVGGTTYTITIDDGIAPPPPDPDPDPDPPPSPSGLSLPIGFKEHGRFAIAVDWSDELREDLFPICQRYTFERGRNVVSTLFGETTANKMTVTIVDYDGDYSQLNGSGHVADLVVPGKRVQLLRLKGSGQIPAWTGWLKTVKPVLKSGSLRLVTLEFEDIIAKLVGTTEIGVNKEIRTDEAVQLLVDDSSVPKDVQKIEAPSAGDEPFHTMPFWWAEEAPGIENIRDVETSEGGFISVAKTGHLYFESRHHRLFNSRESVLDIGDTNDADIYYEKLERLDSIRGVANVITAFVRSFDEGEDQELWKAVGLPWELGGGQTVSHRITAPNDAVISEWQAPVIEVKDSQGRDRLTDAVVTVKNRATHQIVTVGNKSDDPLQITALSAKGKYLTVADGGQVVEEDPDSIELYLRREYTYHFKFNDSHQRAQEFTKTAIETFSKPRAVLRVGFTLVTEEEEALLDILDISKRVSVKSDVKRGIGVDRDYFIERIKGTWQQRKFFLELDLSLPDRRTDYWVLGQSRLGVDTVLA